MIKLGYNDDSLNIMTYTLNSGIKSTIPLSAQQIREWKECFDKDKKFVVVIGNEVYGLNPSLIADWKVHNKYSEHRKHVECINRDMHNNVDLETAYTKAEVLIKVDCKCGTIYTTKSIKRKVWLCSKCKEQVFIIDDKLYDTTKGKVYIMSNKVDRLKNIDQIEKELKVD